MDEIQIYRVVEDELDPVRPHGKPDLSDTQAAGSEENEPLSGLNWFISPNLYITADYIFVDHGMYATEADYVRDSDDPGLFQTRIRLNF